MSGDMSAVLVNHRKRLALLMANALAEWLGGRWG